MLQLRTKFHYAFQVADPVSYQVTNKFVRVCDQLATFLGQKQVADRFELSRRVEIARIWLQTGIQLAFNQLSTGLQHAQRHTTRTCRSVFRSATWSATG